MAPSFNLTAYRDLQFGKLVNRATALPPQAASAAIFTVVGRVLLIALYGEVTTAIGAVANATKVLYNPTAAGASTDLCATLDINAAAVGTMYSLPAAVATGLVTGVSTVQHLSGPRVLGPGGVELSCAGSSVTGAIRWEALFVPLDAGGNLTAA
jgi:hypothetical protein